MGNLRTHDTFPVRAWELTVYIFIAVAGTIGNSLVIAVLRTNKNMGGTAFGTYIGSLAVADLLVCLLCVPIYLTSTSWYKDHPTGAAGDVMCKVFTGYNILFFFATVSVYTLVVLAHERYLAVCKPFQARIKSTQKRAFTTIGIIWVFSALLGILSIIGEKYSPEANASVGAHCTFSNAYNNDIAPKVVYCAVFSIQYIFPITYMIICFGRIRRCLHAKKLRALSCPTQHIQQGELQMIKIRRYSTRTVMIVIVSYFSCWSLNQVLYFCLNFGFLTGINWNGNLMQTSVILCFFSSCINPFIYTLRSQDFRDGFAKILTPSHYVCSTQYHELK